MHFLLDMILWAFEYVLTGFESGLLVLTHYFSFCVASPKCLTDPKPGSGVALLVFLLSLILHHKVWNNAKQ